MLFDIITYMFLLKEKDIIFYVNYTLYIYIYIITHIFDNYCLLLSIFLINIAVQNNSY
jgi:hypothetical protein